MSQRLEQIGKAEDEIEAACCVICPYCPKEPQRFAADQWMHSYGLTGEVKHCVASSIRESRYQRQEESK